MAPAALTLESTAAAQGSDDDGAAAAVDSSLDSACPAAAVDCGSAAASSEQSNHCFWGSEFVRNTKTITYLRDTEAEIRGILREYGRGLWVVSPNGNCAFTSLEFFLGVPAATLRWLLWLFLSLSSPEAVLIVASHSDQPMVKDWLRDKCYVGPVFFYAASELFGASFQLMAPRGRLVDAPSVDWMPPHPWQPDGSIPWPKGDAIPDTPLVVMYVPPGGDLGAAHYSPTYLLEPTSSLRGNTPKYALIDAVISRMVTSAARTPVQVRVRTNAAGSACFAYLMLPPLTAAFCAGR